MFGDARLPDRFWAKVQIDGAGCWRWSGATDGKGYGKIGNKMVRNSPMFAHRVAYEALVGPIPDGLVMDHLCRVCCCVNPVHLEPVTQRENLLRGIGHAAVNASKAACHRGHEFTDENTYKYIGSDKTWHRRCRACQRERSLRYTKKLGRRDEKYLQRVERRRVVRAERRRAARAAP